MNDKKYSDESISSIELPNELLNYISLKKSKREVLHRTNDKDGWKNMFSDVEIILFSDDSSHY